MAVTGAIVSKPDITRRRRNYRISLTFTGSYANSGTTGDLLDFTALTNTAKVERPFPHKVPKDLSDIQVRNMPVGFMMTVELGTSISAAVGIRLWRQDGSTGPLTELANGAYPAAITGSTQAIIEVSEEN